MKKYKFHELMAISLITLFLAVFVLFIIQESSPDFLGSITGHATFSNQTVPTTVNVSKANMSLCNFTLSPGWNLVSFFCWYKNMNRNDALEPIDGSYVAVFSYYASDSADPWKSYNPSLPNWAVQDLNSMSRLNGYWIYMNSNETYELVGIKTPSNTVPIIEGWNLVGYTSSNPRTAGDAFSSINGSYSAVAIYNSSSGSYLYYYPVGGNSSDFNITQPYKGYWINATTDDTWVLT